MPVILPETIVRRRCAALIPYARNARTHSDQQVAQIAASMREFGFTNPVLIDEEDGIIAGHGRVLAAHLLGLDEVPCIVLAHLTPSQRRAYVLADNKLALNAGWDLEMLSLEIGELGEAGFDLSLIGFDEFELGELFAERTQGRTDPDDAPEPPAHPVAEPGDLWVLGGHRLLCGDSTVATDVARVLGDVAPHLMVTDPPYGVNYDPAWRNQAGRSINGTTRRIAAGTVIKPIGARAVGKVVNDDRADWREAWALFPGSVAYIWHAGTKAGIVQDSLAACGFETRSQIIWAKNNFAIGRGHYHCKHEPCWYVVRKGSTASWVGDHSQTTLWQIDKNLKSETGHGTQKPVECMRRPIENNSSPGQAVYEPFSGSFTTGVACEMTGRTCIAIELSPQYVDVGVIRWQEFAGKEAVLEETGETFAEVSIRRQVPQSRR